MFDNEAPADAGETARLVSASQRALVDHECRLLVLAAHWADLHGEPESADRPGGGRVRLYGGLGTPEVSEFAAAELGVLLETTTGGAAALMADGLDLRHRLPLLWARVMSGGVRVWKARAVAKATRHLGLDAAGTVDDRVAGSISTVPWGRFETLLTGTILTADPADAARRQALYDADRFVRASRTSEHGLKLLVARANAGDVIWFMAMVDRIADLLNAEGDPEPVDVRRSRAIGILAQPAVALAMLCRHHSDAAHPADPAEPVADQIEGGESVSVSLAVPTNLDEVPAAKLRPPVTLYLHLSEETVRAETGVARMEGVGPVLTSRLKAMLLGCQVTVKPVLDPDCPPVDGYEIPTRIREQVVLRSLYDVFPFGTTESRGLDLDHTEPYRSAGPPGQTAPGRLGPLTRGHHRVKTHSGWEARQPSPGVMLWRTPHGWVSLVTNQGTLVLGNTEFARHLWQSATPAARRDFAPAS